MPHPRLFGFALAVTVCSAAALAQPPASPLDRAIESPADAPATIDDRKLLTDPEIQRLMTALIGSFAAAATADTPALRFNACEVTVDGLDNAVYFEITREDAPASPFRQGIFHAFRRGAGASRELWLRVFEFRGGGQKDILTALWAAPDAIPRIEIGSLIPNLDLVLGASGATTWQGTVPHAYPTARDGAIEMTATISISPDQIKMADAGFSAAGLQVWGQRGVDGPLFKRSTDAPVSVRRVEGGLIVITLTKPEPDAERLVENGQVAVHYTGWLSDGTRFDSSRLPDRDAFMLRVPGPVIKGWNEGLKEISHGERRRLIIPPAMAYGDQGTRDRRIPANSTLIFDVECVYIDNTVPTPPPQQAPAPMTPHGGATPPPQPKPTGEEPK